MRKNIFDLFRLRWKFIVWKCTVTFWKRPFIETKLHFYTSATCRNLARPVSYCLSGHLVLFR